MSRKRRDGGAVKQQTRIDLSPAETLKEGEPDWNDRCDICGDTPTVYPIGLCGPCCFGEAATAGGNW